MWGPVKKLFVTALVAVVFGFVYFAASWYIVNSALVAEAHALVHTPADHGMRYEDVTFHPRGDASITLRGWWMPATGATDAIVFVHGLDSTRDSRMDLLAELNAKGFSVLTFDLRGHGESDKAQMGAGYKEGDDLRGAIDYVMRERGIEAGHIGVAAISLGGAVSILALPGETAVHALFADSSFASLSDVVVREVADRTSLPLWGAALFRPGIVQMGRLVKGIDIGLVVPERSVASLPYPIAIAHCDADTRIAPRDAERLRANAPDGSTLDWFHGCEHAGGHEADEDGYNALAVRYFEQRLRGG
jgi:pimeloyl-ACP methyl ester carboxylesterase